MAAKCGNIGNAVQVTLFVIEIRKVTQGSSNNWHRGSTYLRQEVEAHSEEKLSTTARSTVSAVGAICSWYEECKSTPQSLLQINSRSF